MKDLYWRTKRNCTKKPFNNTRANKDRDRLRL